MAGSYSITALLKLGILVNNKKYLQLQFISPPKGFC